MADLVHKLLYAVDWSAVSTIILTAITGYYAWSTRHMLRATARQATAAERTVEILGGEQRRHLEQCQAPILNGIKEGRALVDQWLAADFMIWREPNAWPDSRELELSELAELISQARSLWFPLSVLLSRVETQIVKTRFVIDEMTLAPDDAAFGECSNSARAELYKLQTMWIEAENEVQSWR